MQIRPFMLVVLSLLTPTFTSRAAADEKKSTPDFLKRVPDAVAQVRRLPPEEKKPLPDSLKRPARKPAADANDLTKLLIERYNAVREEAQRGLATWKEGYSSLDDPRIVEPVRRLVDAELELITKREERLKLLEEHLKFLQEIERILKERDELGGARGVKPEDVARARYYRLEAEIRLVRARRQKDRCPPAPGGVFRQTAGHTARK